MSWTEMTSVIKRVYLDVYYYLFPLHRLRKSGAVIGQQVFWGKHVRVELENAHLLTIEDNVTVSAGTSLILHDASLQKVAGFDLLYGRIVLRQGAYIGAHTVILPGTDVGSGTIVGANSLIKGSLESHSVYFGQPARRHGTVQELIQKWKTRRQKIGHLSKKDSLIFFTSQPEQWP